MKLLKVIAIVLVGWSALDGAAQTDWHARLRQELPLLGHRNWIAIVDSAYPLQTSAGVETIETGSDEVSVVREVLASLAEAKHVRPVVMMDAELPLVSEDAPGVTRYREEVKSALGDRPVQYLLHERLIRQIDEIGGRFHILVLKTTLTVPYSSVFLRLDCKYWSDAAEDRLRKAMAAAQAK
jgi:L-fucose mutarotase/ribose pyranase (RbsD/FucU family)